ncbi:MULTISPECIES: type II secretion system F family protein [Colwellia]|uniref:MSHA biogenesis protein MshG n=1 Tax=Colwellia psychrerythraea (strain 34H / ATCC BAA-681) TaxID=167879 RepID=Q47VF2_COLP3|nr:MULTISPECIES: type II secretion system F family protein [Colwellia]AAZ24715.1 MSHA biogenesis protein MshG [Colwellia psychrerythraea 34H]PKH85699.1 type II secretion system F family protein [Colwellia sp. Bg11-28]
MASFKYTGRNANGSQVKDSIDAANVDIAAEKLFKKGITPISIIAAKTGGNAASIDVFELLNNGRVSLEELIVFCRQMYALMRSGVPILRAINGMVESANSISLKKALTDIGKQLEGGYTFSSALNGHPKIFDHLFVSLVHVGENTGQLDQAFLKLTTYLERELDTRKRIKAALRYPSMVLIAIAAAMVILNIFVIPTFANMFTRLGAELPFATRFIIASSNLFINYWHYMLLGIFVVLIMIRKSLKTKKGRYQWDRRKIKIPIIGSIIERSILARFSHSFAIVLKAGVPMTTGLTLVAEAVDNSYMQEKISAMRQGIESGESLLRSAVASALFTPLVLQMVAVGEETGRVDELLTEVGDYYEREVDYDLATLTARIEPLLLVVVAAMVLVLALGIFTPMWDMASAMQG